MILNTNTLIPQEKENEIFNEIKTSQKKEKDETIYNQSIMNSLDEIIKELEKIRGQIRGNKLDSMPEKDFYSLDDDFSLQINKYDELKSEEDFTKEELNKLYKDNLSILYLNKCLAIQTLISRIAHKINKHKNDILINKYEKKLQLLENTIESFSEANIQFENLNQDFSIIKTDIEKNKENILTISSLVFTAFTLIQLNFTAFQNSNTYNVLDRLILFSGINIFTILGIYTIFSMIKSFIKQEKVNFSIKKISIKPELLILLIFLIVLSGVFISTLFIKSQEENKSNLNYNNIYINDISVLKEEVDNLKKRSSHLENKLDKYTSENKNKFDSLKLEIQTEKLNIDREILLLEKKINNISK